MNITLTREEAQQVLDALEAEHSAIYGTSQTEKAIETLRARLEQPEPSAEPEAYKLWVLREVLFHNGEPIAYREPQREWQGLTDEEIRNEAKNHVFDESFFSGAVWARGQIMGKTMNENKPEVRSDIDQIYSAVMADTEALEDAKMTLEVIKKTDPGVYDEMIDDTLSLIRKALSNSILGAIDRLVDPEEPVAWVVYDSENNDIVWTEAGKKLKQNTRLYTAPPQREWQGLTSSERKVLWLAANNPTEFGEMLEAKLKEKNA